ncbi:MAG: hypothetical protein H0W36_00690 [Gemmatimonadetes bacterium]|nr:hypothetical protein [Gemmatimonadota bacterium]
MNHKDDIELRRAALLKAARSAVRLRHSLEADAELNDVLPNLERRFNDAVQRGVLLDIGETLREYVLLDT